MLRRKVENLLTVWKKSRKALLIDGARQVGKTYILRKYADENFGSSIYLNLLENKSAVTVLSQSSDTKDFLRRLSALVDSPYIKGNTVIFLDEIQELTRCYDLVTTIKFLVDEGSYRYIFSGSMLGVELTDAKSWPVGYLTTKTMFPLDFEEFLWANNVNNDLINRARECFMKKIPLEDYIHEKLMRLFHYYLLVGGMPDAVNAFAETGDFNQVALAHRTIQSYNRKDISYKSSTAEIVFEFFKHNGLNISKYSAQSLYCGIYDDTLAFSLGRCDEETFKKVNFLVECGASPSFIANKLLRRDSLAKYRIIPKVLDSLELHKDGEIATIYALEEWFKTTGAHARDCEDALDMIMSMQRVQVAFFIRFTNGACRVSLRSKNELDVSKIASIFDGGGHFNASGCTIDTKDVEVAKNVALKEGIKDYGQ